MTLAKQTLRDARTLILRAMAHGASVVTANKALMALRVVELWDQARAAGVSLQPDGIDRRRTSGWVVCGITAVG